MLKKSSNRLLLVGLFFVILTTVSCRHKSNGKDLTDNNVKEVDKKAADYLQSVLHVGESSEDLINKFGSPSEKYITQSNELCLAFLFSDQNQPKLARLAGVGGVSAFLVSNQLIYWIPVYEFRAK